jgi:hypothetical protein
LRTLLFRSTIDIVNRRNRFNKNIILIGPAVI